MADSSLWVILKLWVVFISSYINIQPIKLAAVQILYYVAAVGYFSEFSVYYSVK